MASNGGLENWCLRSGRSYEAWTATPFFLSTVLQDAASKCAEAIGEAAGKLDDLDPALNDAFPDLNLILARRSRDRLSPGYYQIDLAIFWDTVTDAIPKTVAAANAPKLSYD